MIQPPLHRLPAPALLIGDRRLQDASGGERKHVYAATGRATLPAPMAGAREVDLAVRQAQTASASWRSAAGAERARILHAVGTAIEDASAELAEIQAIESAVPISFAEDFPKIAASFFHYNADWADRIDSEVTPAGRSADSHTHFEPYGVVGAIIPWNASLIAASQVLAPVLAAGNTVVLKPSPLAPFSALRLAELALEAGMPPGVINVVAGEGLAGDSLVRHPGVSKVHFTGSPETARKVLAAAAENIVPVCLELGGKSPLLVFPDADPFKAAQISLSAIAGLSGQGCALPTRVLVAEEIYSKLLVLLKGLLRRVQVGDPMEPATQAGPLISSAACERVLGTIARAQQQNEGKLIAGGQRLDGALAEGYFVAPTVFSDVQPESQLARDEIFGPVLSVMSFGSEEEAVRMANDCRYGLAAYLLTDDPRRAERVGAALDVGSIQVNGQGPLDPSIPFGGYKQSGYGRLGGWEGIREFTRTKNISQPIDARERLVAR